MADGQSSDQPLLGLSLAFREAQRKLQEQLATADSLDVKMGVLVGFLGALLTGILAAVLVAEPGKVHALLNPAGSSSHPVVWGWVIFGLFALDAGLVAAALITSFNAYRPRNLKSGIPFKVLYEWTNEPTREIKFIFLPTLKRGIELNEGILGSKQRSAQKAAWLTLGALLALLLTAAALVIRLKLYL